MPPRGRWRKKSKEEGDENPLSHDVRDSHPEEAAAQVQSLGSGQKEESSSSLDLNIVWHKHTDLRLLDHEPAYFAHRNSSSSQREQRVLHLHLVDSRYYLTGKSRLAKLPRCSAQRARFWLESVRDLDESIEKLVLTSPGGSGSSSCNHSFVVVYTERHPAEFFEKLAVFFKNHELQFQREEGQNMKPKPFQKYRLRAVHVHREFCVEELKTEERVEKVLEAYGTELVRHWGAVTVTHIDDLGFEREQTSAVMPDFKGEFNKMAKRCRPFSSSFLGSTGKGKTGNAGNSSNVRPHFPAPDEWNVAWKQGIDKETFSQLLKDVCSESSVQAEEERLSDNMILAAFPGLCEEQSSFGKPRHQKTSTIRLNPASHAGSGGETSGLEYLHRTLLNLDCVEHNLFTYRGATESFAHGEETNPVQAGSRLSAWLAFGCLSPRYVVNKAQEFEWKYGSVSSSDVWKGDSYGFQKGRGGVTIGSSKTGKGKDGKYLVQKGKTGSTGARLHTELLFRDFLRYSALLKWGSKLFEESGPFEIDYHLSKSIEGINDKKLQKIWITDISQSAAAFERFERWKNGMTGFPFVDAGMRELKATGYMSHLHRQCCAAFLVRDLAIDWRLGAEWFEACLVDYTPDANWGNWAYRILMRPELIKTRSLWMQSSLIPRHLSTLECVVWPVVHDSKLSHTLTWVPELKLLPTADERREPWRCSSSRSTGGDASKTRRVDISPYKDSPLWFCAANRVHWDYEYYWLPGGGFVYTVRKNTSGKQKVVASSITIESRATRASGGAEKSDFVLGKDYPEPIIPPVDVEIRLGKLPLKKGEYAWGDSHPDERPHIVG